MVSVAGVARGGDVRLTLEAVRDVLAQALDDADANVKPQVAAQLRATLQDLAGLPPVEVRREGVVTIGDAKRRRADRQSGASAAAVAGESKR